MIFLITNTEICKGNISKRIEEAVANEVDFILIREKQMEISELNDLVSKSKKIVLNSKTKLIIAHNKKISKENNILLHNSFKELNENTFLISLHSLDEVSSLIKTQVSYAFLGHVFETNCKKELRPKGIEVIKNSLEITKDSNLEIVALGGINKNTIKLLKNLELKSIGIMSEWLTCNSVSELIKEYRSYGY